MSKDEDSKALRAAAVLGGVALLVLAFAALAAAINSDEPISGPVSWVMSLGLIAGVAVLVTAAAIALVGGALKLFDDAFEKPWQAVTKDENEPTVVLALMALLAGGFVYAARQVSEKWSPVWSFTLTIGPLLIAAVSAGLVSASVRESDAVRMGWLDRAVLGVKFIGVLLPLLVVAVGAFTQDWWEGFGSLNTSEKALLILSGVAYALGVILLVVLLRRQRKADLARTRPI